MGTWAFQDPMAGPDVDFKMGGGGGGRLQGKEKSVFSETLQMKLIKDI